ncbi:MAG: hypothetical protein ACRD8A_12600 [Candidatus Acidiferrales bacterium]
MKKLVLMLVALAIGAAVCPQAKAQNGQRAATARNAMGLAIPAANVTVCTYSAGNYSLVNGVWTYSGPVPCTTPTTVYADPALANPITQPVVTGGNGNYTYYMAAGTQVTECVTGAQVVSSCYAVVVGGGNGGGGGGGGTDCSQTSVQSDQVCAGPLPNLSSILQSNAGAWSYASGSSFTEQLAYSQPVTQGQVLFVVEMGDYLAYPNGSLPPPANTVTDSQGNAFTYLAGSDFSPLGHRSAHAQIFTATAGTSGTDTISGRFTTLNHGLFIAALSSLGSLDSSGGGETTPRSGQQLWQGSIHTNSPDIIIGVMDMVSCCTDSSNTLSDTTWNVLNPGIVPHIGLSFPSQFYGLAKYAASPATYNISFNSFDTTNVFANGAGVYLWAFNTSSRSSGSAAFRLLSYADLPNGGNLVLPQTPLVNNGDLMTVVGGALAALPLGASNTFVGNCGGSLGSCFPTEVGFSPTPQFSVAKLDATHPVPNITPQPLSSWGTCATAEQGALVAVTDSTTNTQGATVTGSGGTPVLGYCNGVNWLVVSGVSTGGGGGSATSVGLSLPSFFSISGSPVTTTGTLTAAYNTGLTSNELNVLGVNGSGAAGLYGISSLVQGLSGCGTAGNVYTPQGNDCTPQSGGVSSITGDSNGLISNSASTGVVTITLNSTGVSYGVFGSTGATSGAPGYHSLSSYPAAAFPTLNQNTTGTAAGLTGCSPSTSGDLCYWSGSGWLRFAGNNSGTNCFFENPSGIPSWATCGGIQIQTGTVNNASQSLINFLTSSTNSIGGVLTPFNPSDGQERFELTGVINASGGGTGLSSPAAHALPVTEGASSFKLLPSPTSNGNCVVSFNVTTGAAVDPACALLGAAWNPQNAGYTVAYSDRAGAVPFTGTVPSTYTIPVHTAAGFGGSMVFSSPNFGTATLTLSPTTDTIDGGSTQSVFPGWDDVNFEDTGGNWHTIRVPMFPAFPNCNGASNALIFTPSTGIIGCNSIAGGTAILASLQEGTNTAITGAGTYLQQTYNSSLTSTYSGAGTSGNPFIWTLGINLSNGNTWTATQTFPNGSLTNVELANPSATVGGLTCTLGSTCFPSDTTTTVGTTVIAANACTGTTTVTMSGLTTAMSPVLTPTTDISSTIGWSPSSIGQLYFTAWVSAANTLSYKVCNPTASSITPGGSTTWTISAR